MRPDGSVIGTAGSFVSIDSRPVTCARGVLKQLITIYKRYVRSACFGHAEKITNPFLCMNIVCPLGTYDANVEPAKDDVLFVDQSRLLLMLETFFISVYGALEVSGDKKIQKGASQHGSKDQKGFGLLLARKPQSTACSTSPSTDIPTIEIDGNADYMSSTQDQMHADADDAIEQDKTLASTQELAAGSSSPTRFEKVGQNLRDVQNPEDSPGGHHAADGETPSQEKRTWHFSMYDGDEEGIWEHDAMSARPAADDFAHEEGLKDVTVSNPWTMAKMNSSGRPGPRSEPGGANGYILENGQLMTPAREGLEHRTTTIIPSHDLVHRKRGNIPNLQTPQQTPRSPSPSPKDVSSAGAWHFPSKPWGKAQSDVRNEKIKVRALERDGGRGLDTWIRSSPNIRQPAEGIKEGHFTQGLLEDMRKELPEPSQRVHANSNGFISARTLQQGTQLSDIPEAPPKRTPRLGVRKQLQQGAINKQFVSPVNDPTKVWFEMEPQRRARQLPQAQPHRVRNTIAATAPIRFESETEDIVEETTPVNPIPPLSHPTQLNLEDLMEYEHRKSAATRTYKSSLQNQASKGSATPNTERVDKACLPSANSPHRNRYEAAKAALTPSKDNTDNTPPIFAEGDSRAYLIRFQKREEESAQRDGRSMGGPSNKQRRARTTMLPLETIAADRQVHSLVLDVSTGVPSIKGHEERLIDTDEYVRRGEIACGSLADVSDINVQAWKQKLSNLLKKTYGLAESGDGTEEVTFDFSPALRQHLAAYP